MFLVIKRAVGLIAATTLVVSWFLWGFFSESYSGYALEPDQLTGALTPHHTKSKIVYLTAPQNELLNWLLASIAISIVLILAIFIIHGGDPFKSPKYSLHFTPRFL